MFIKPPNMSDSETEVMLSLNSPMTQRGRDYCHVLKKRLREVIELVQGHIGGAWQSRDSDSGLLISNSSFH